MPGLKRIALGFTGASGARYGVRVLQELLRVPGIEVHLTVSPAAREVLRVEEGVEVDLEHFNPKAFGIKKSRSLIYHHHTNVGAPMASGSFRLDGMAIVPCSMGCVGRLANGISGDLVERAGDVCIKERRRLVIVPRETPFSAIHLENLLKLSRAGVTVLPAAPGFYGKPTRVEDLVDFIAARVLDHLGLEHRLGPRWGEGHR
jgi:4-hydroxy-3-polyprenylbenzoate decarboxylase